MTSRRASIFRSPASSARQSLDIAGPIQPLSLARLRQATLDDEGSPTCLSALPHEPGADRDSLFQHYLGCIEFHERAGFLDKNSKFWKQQVENEILKLKSSSKTGTASKKSEAEIRDEAHALVKKTIDALAVSIEAQYKRTVVLRRALSKENPSDQPEKNPNAPGAESLEPKNFVGYVDQSRQRWRDSAEYKTGIEKVRNWRKKHGLPTDTRDSATTTKEAGRDHIQKIVGELRGLESMEEKITGYNLERDVNAYLIQYTRKPKSTANNTDPEPKADPKMRHLPIIPFEEKLEDVRFKGKFPDQRLSVDLLLRSAHSETSEYDRDILHKSTGQNGVYRNILSKDSCDKKDPTRMRYLHIPANNMESAIAGYYGDPHPALRSGHRESPATTQTQMLLRPQFWRGQLHGARSGVVHARYMRPLCERLSSSVHEIEDNPNNIVLFMPYMHWETDRMRNTVAKMIDDQSYKQLLKQEKNDLKAKDERIKKRDEVKDTSKRIEHTEADPNDLRTVLSTKQTLDRSLTGLVPRITKLSHGGVEVEEDGHLRVSSERPLGQYLIDAARLYEAMSTFRDKRMIEKYLYKNPPLHPRRTLDQSHYWTLKTTKARDRDQVVYRGTNINVDLCHKFRKVPKKPAETPRWKEALKNFTFAFKEHDTQDVTAAPQGQTQQRVSAESRVTGSSRFNWLPWSKKQCKHEHWQWIGHWSKTDKHGCEHCTSEIKKVSKLIMVDQLWMWVLDEQTVITFFPRRYGYNKYDLHGIHKSIRTRLANARKNQIRSIFDVALIILDECSNTFFDRTKTHDSQPQVMDIFSEAIGDVTNKHTISFQHVWHWTQKASDVYRSKPKQNDTSDLHVPLLDIHPEGKLQREVKDILDELDIMINITRRQRELIRRFCKHVDNILDPEGRWRQGSDGQSFAPVDDEDPDEDPPAAEKGTSTPAAGSQSGTKKDDSVEAQRDKEVKEKEAGEKEARDKEKKEETRDRIRRKKHLDWFRMQSQDLLCEVGDRIDELEGLRESAKSTAQSVNDLLSLKQQQASVVQAWESVNQAEEAVRQGRSIMMFTIITIVFLPLSFMSSIFGMNNVDFEDGNNTWTLREQLRFMFPISFGIIVVSLFIAFYGFLRASIWSGYTYAVTWIAVHTGLYSLWLEYGSKNFKSASMMRETADKVHQLKESVRRTRRKKKAKEIEARKLSKGGGGADEKTERDSDGVGLPVTNGIVKAEVSETEKADRQPGTPARASRAESPRSRGQSVVNGRPRISFADEQPPGKDVHAGTSDMV